jgi:hypothetical protein
LYWLGTEKGTKPWKNPHISRRVTVTASSTHSYFVPSVSQVVNCKLDKDSFFTNDREHSWIQIHFNTCRICPTHYTLGVQGHSGCRTDFPRNWVFEGSDDGKNWSSLKERILITAFCLMTMSYINDTSVNLEQRSHTWRIDNCDKYFSVSSFISRKYLHLRYSGYSKLERTPSNVTS